MIPKLTSYLMLFTRAIALYPQEDAWHKAIAGTYSGPGCEWSIYGNPAALAGDSGWAVTATYADHFFIPELDRKQIGFSRSGTRHAAGISVTRTGDQRLLRTEMALSIAKIFGPSLSIGLRLTGFQHANASPYGTLNGGLVVIGGSANIGKHTCFSTVVHNPGRVVLYKEPEDRLPTVLTAGIRHELSKRFWFVVEYRVSTSVTGEVKLACHYVIRSNLAILSGISVQAQRFCLGWSMAIAPGLQLILASSHEPTLGFTSALSLAYRPNQPHAIH